MRHHAPLLIRLSPWCTGQELLPELLDILRSIRWLAESRFSSSTPGKLRNPPEGTGTGHDHELQQLGESHYRDRQQLCFRRQLPTNCWSATVDGKLTAPGGLNLKAGTLVGLGTVAATVTSGASIKAGDSATRKVIDSRHVHAELDRDTEYHAGRSRCGHVWRVVGNKWGESWAARLLSSWSTLSPQSLGTASPF
jgi:hypothetical protein